MRIIDSHNHIMKADAVRLLQLSKEYGTEKLGLLSIPCYGLMHNNLECLLIKKLAPERAYVYGGITYLPGVEPTGADARRELELLVEAGCDGWKLLESKPSIYRQLQLPLDGPAFEPAFALAEETGLPVIWHTGDPATFWDAEKAPEFAVRNGWLCIGEGYPTLEELYRQVEAVLTKHPGLKASMAHLFFTSDNRPYAEHMLTTYPHLWFDITPGSEMYWNFARDPQGWRAFFERFQDQLVYGTDLEDIKSGPEEGKENVWQHLVHKMLMSGEPFTYQGKTLTGMNLSPQALEKLMGGNFERRNPTIKPLNLPGVQRYAEWLMNRLPKEEQARCEELLRQF